MKVDSERSLLNLEAYVKNAQDGEAVKQSGTLQKGDRSWKLQREWG
jgi:hypothetical protein